MNKLKPLTHKEEHQLSKIIATVAATLLTGMVLTLGKTIIPVWIQLILVPTLFAAVLTLGHWLTVYEWRNTWLFVLHRVIVFTMLHFAVHFFWVRMVLGTATGYIPGATEVSLIAITLMGGAIMGVVLCLPFKMIQGYYYDYEDAPKVPGKESAVDIMRREKQQADATAHHLTPDQAKMKLAIMNETQLRVALTEAVNLERFEMAKLIQTELERFR